MNYKELLERIGQREVDRAEDSILKQKVREPGDVGKVDRLKQMNRNKSKRTRVADTADRMATAVEKPELTSKANEILADMGIGGKRGSKRVKRDEGDYQQYTRQVRSMADKMGVDPEAASEAPPGFGLGGKDAVTQADKEFDQVIQKSAAPTAREPLKLTATNRYIELQNRLNNKNEKDEEEDKIKDSAYYQHAYQGSGVGVANKKELDDEYLDALVGASLDIDKYDPKKNQIPITQRPKDEDLKIQDPSPRDVEAHSDEGERIGAETKAYLTPEVMAQQKQMRNALRGQDSRAVQRQAFKHEVTDEMLDAYIAKFGVNDRRTDGEYKAKLMAQVSNYGGTSGERGEATYGGDLGPDADEWKISDDVYDWNNLPPDIKKQALENRTREIIRTYLKQGGVNAYAQHEGLRSIADMDLEHIKSLKQGGRDHPENWVFASQNLNRLRGDQDLGPVVDKRVDDQGVGLNKNKLKQGVPLSVRSASKSFKDFFKGEGKGKKDAFVKEFGDVTKKDDKGVFDAKAQAHLSDDEIKANRERAIKHYGMSPEQANTLFPDKGRISGNPYGTKQSKFERDFITNQRDQVLYRQGLEKLKKMMRVTGNKADANKKENKLVHMTDKDFKASPEVVAFKKSFKDTKAAYQSPEEIMAALKAKREFKLDDI